MTDQRSLAREVTPKPLYLNRRTFFRLGAAAASMVATGMIYRWLNRTGSMSVDADEIGGYLPAHGRAAGFDLDEAKTPLEQVVNYNNLYEFTTDKEAVGSVPGRLSQNRGNSSSMAWSTNQVCLTFRN
jgi:hypothetical protein